jgi:hypothetical protein
MQPTLENLVLKLMSSEFVSCDCISVYICLRVEYISNCVEMEDRDRFTSITHTESAMILIQASECHSGRQGSISSGAGTTSHHLSEANHSLGQRWLCVCL